MQKTLFSRGQWLFLIVWSLVNLYLLVAHWHGSANARKYFWPFEQNILNDKTYDLSEFVVYVGAAFVGNFAFNIIRNR